MSDAADTIQNEVQPSVSANPLGKIGWMLAASLTFRVSSGITTLVLAFFLSVADYGAFMNAIFWSLMIVLLAGSGLPDLIVRDGSHRDAPPLASQLNHAWLLCLMLGSLFLTILLISLSYSGLADHVRLLVLLTGIAAIITALNYIGQAAFRLTGRISWQARIMMATALLTNGGLLTLAILGKPVLWLGYWYILAFLGIMCLHIYSLSRLNLLSVCRIRISYLRRMCWQTLPFGLVPVLMMLLPVLSSSLALHGLTPNLAGSFSLILSIYLAALAVSLVLDQVFYPMLSEPDGDARARMSGYLITAITISFPALILFSWLGPDLADLVFAGKYPQLDLILPILGMLIPIRFLSHALSVPLRRRNRQRYTITAFGLGIISMILLSLIFPGLLANRPSLQVFAIALLVGEAVAFALLAISAANQLDGRLFIHGLVRITGMALAAIAACQAGLVFGLPTPFALLLAALAFLITGMLVRLPAFIARDCINPQHF